MPTLHGSWIVKPANSYFFFWGETWRNLDKDTIKSLANSESLSLHPYHLTRAELLTALQSYNLHEDFLAQDSWQSETILLPSQTLSKKKEIVPILSEQISSSTLEKKSLNLQSWQVEGFRLNRE
jgi:hypothetical protein